MPSLLKSSSSSSANPIARSSITPAFGSLATAKHLLEAPLRLVGTKTSSLVASSRSFGELPTRVIQAFPHLRNWGRKWHRGLHAHPLGNLFPKSSAVVRGTRLPIQPEIPGQVGHRSPSQLRRENPQEGDEFYPGKRLRVRVRLPLVPLSRARARAGPSVLPEHIIADAGNRVPRIGLPIANRRLAMFIKGNDAMTGKPFGHIRTFPGMR